MVRVVDLFSGVGGLTLGFKKEIFKNRFIESDRFSFVFANEIDEYASRAFSENFPDINMIEGDISKINARFLSSNDIDFEDIDVVIGGPPCQSFSTVGKRQFDNRANMYKEYKRMLVLLKPKIFIFENVKGILSMKNNEGEPVIEEIKKSFSRLRANKKSFGYDIHMKVLDAYDFGVPQKRERVFIVGIRKDLDVEYEWQFPRATSKSPISLYEAIGDLPALNQSEIITEYNTKPFSKYQRLMKGNQRILKDHFYGTHGERLNQIIDSLGYGESKRSINDKVNLGVLSKDLYLTSGYDNTYARLWWEKPSTTITNNLSTPSSLRCIHPRDNRALSSREGARLQSFPDNFQFLGSQRQINTQIGNAVPPLLALALANSVYDFITNNFGG